MAKKLPPLVTPGQKVDGYTVIEQAPADLIRGSRTRALDGHLVTGSWAEPWWLYSREHGWALAKRWRSKRREITERQGDGTVKAIVIGARDELVIEAWPAPAQEAG